MGQKRSEDQVSTASTPKKVRREKKQQEQKEQKEQKEPDEQQQQHLNGRPSSTIIAISRSIAACQRCRQKKTKCDQKFPSCGRCEKAGVPCVGLDPATGRQVPRSYIIYLEDKISSLEAQLKDNGIVPGKENWVTTITNNSPVETKASPVAKASPTTSTTSNTSKKDTSIQSSLQLAVPSTNTGVSFYLGDSSGISFAKLLFTAVKFHPNINESNSITTQAPVRDLTQNFITGMLPNKKTAESLIKIFFEQSNPQLPVLHREIFVNTIFKPIYGNISKDIKLASNYTNTNFDTSPIGEDQIWYNVSKSYDEVPEVYRKNLFFLNIIFAISTSVNLLQYHSNISNSYKLEAMKYIDSLYQCDDRLEILQGLLLLTLYSLMRPSIPGVWYILGTTTRLCVDLGLHSEKLNNQVTPFVKDLRRRLFWCTYSLDRQICVYLGRPFGIPEQSITTKFPLELDDCLINVDEAHDFVNESNSLPTYKIISINFFKMRRLQSEILQILYFPNSILPRFYDNINDWKLKMNSNLESWYNSTPLKSNSRKSNCNFNTNFFKLNYFHTKLILFGINPKNPKLNQESLKVIFDSSKGIIQCYLQFFEQRAINYTWACVHNLFMAGTSFFYSIYYSNESLITLSEYEKTVENVNNILNSLIELCDAASSCMEIFQILSLAIIKLKFDNQLTRYDEFNNIDKFFTQLNKIPEPINDKANENSEPVMESNESNDPSANDNQDYPSLSTPPISHETELSNPTTLQDFEQQRIFDILNQVSSDNIWDQFFGNGYGNFGI